MIKAGVPELNGLSATGNDKGAIALPHKAWIWPHLLSLDAVCVALIWQQLFADSAGVTLLPVERACLGLAVWIIYTADRLLDSFGPLAPLTARHLLYLRCRKTALIGVMATLCAELLCCAQLERSIFLCGLVLSALVGLYLLSVHRATNPLLRLPKELEVATLFAIGTALVPVTRAGIGALSLLGLVLFLGLCLLNCASVEYREWQRHPSSLRLPEYAALLTRNLSLAAGLIVLAAILARPVLPSRELYGAIVLSALALVVFHRTQHRMSADAMRVLVDIPLMLPLLLVIMRLYEL